MTTSDVVLIVTMLSLLAWQIFDYIDRTRTRKWTALQWALDALPATDIGDLSTCLTALTEHAPKVIPSTDTYRKGLFAMDHLELVSISIDRGYLDRDLFIAARVHDLHILSQDFTALQDADPPAWLVARLRANPALQTLLAEGSALHVKRRSQMYPSQPD